MSVGCNTWIRFTTKRTKDAKVIAVSTACRALTFFYFLRFLSPSSLFFVHFVTFV
jgi:hypothetical protein